MWYCAGRKRKVACGSIAIGDYAAEVGLLGLNTFDRTCDFDIQVERAEAPQPGRPSWLGTPDRTVPIDQ